MAYSHARRVESWLRVADLGLLLVWAVVAYYLFPVQWQTTLAWVMGAAWYAGIMAVGGQNAAYLHPRYRILISMALALALASVIGIFWAGSGRDWYLKGGIYFLGALGIAGTLTRLLVAALLQRPAMQLVPCRLPDTFAPLLDELRAQPHIYLETPLEDTAGPLPERRERFPILMVVTDLRLRADTFQELVPLQSRVEIVDICDFYESYLGKVAIVQTAEGWWLPQAMRVPSPLREAGKRAFDAFVVLLTMPLTLPVIALGALAVRLTSRGPIFFTQQRLGRYGEPFQLVKLRTMRVDAEAAGPQWAGARDPRVTPVGRLLRTTGIDELPQLWNVLRGEMSLIGPRPELPRIVETLERDLPFYRARLLVAPGLTGWAQLHQGGDASLDDVAHKLRYDLYYIKYGSMLLDLRILGLTAQMLLHLAKPAPKAKPATVPTPQA